MSGVEPCAPPGVTGTLVTTAALCDALDAASKVDLKLPEVTPPTPLTDELMPAALRKAMNDCTGTSSCKFIGYDFDSELATPASASPYVVDTYSTTVENSGVLVSKGKKTSGTVAGVTPDATTGGSTGTVMYTADNGQTYTFQGKWRSVQTSGVSVDVYFDPANMSRGALRPEDLGFAPPVLVEPPGYELPDFQAASTTPSNLISRLPGVASVEECAKKCDETDTCDGFNFGGLDTSSMCELVKDTKTNRAYADGMSGFRKETISRTQTGDGTNPSGTDLTNEGVYCRDALACNTDIARLITENVGATNPIAALSTTDIESCAYCPIRTYATAGNVTTNEIGVSKSNPTPAAAIEEIQYSSDGTFASHLTITAGRWYKVSSWKEQTSGGRLDFYMSPIATTSSTFNLLCLRGGKFFVAKNFNSKWPLSETIGDTSAAAGDTGNMSITFTPVDYVTDGFIINGPTGPFTLKLEDVNYTISVAAGVGYSSVPMTETNFWHLKPLTRGRLTIDYNDAVFVLTEITDLTTITSVLTSKTQDVKYCGDSKCSSTYTVKYVNPLIYVKQSEYFKLEGYNGQLVLRKFTDPVIFSWYKEDHSETDGPFINSWKPISYDSSPLGPPINLVDSGSPFWTLFSSGPDMPDPYAALGQFRTLDVAPPSTAQSWAYSRRQGCDKNCGNVQNGYAIYKCTASGGGNCDPGKGASVSGPVCAGTHISCRPGDDSTDLKAQFSFKFRGLLPASSKVTAGGSNSDHDTDALRVRTIYSLDSTFSVTTTPNESIQKIYAIFPSFVVDRILRTKGLESLVPAALCSSGTYVRDYGFGLKACEICPGNPTLASNQVFQPDTVNPGNFMCTVTTCPTGQQRDLLTNRCRIPCLPGQYVAADGSCATCPDQTLAINQYWTPDITNIGSSTCVKNQCSGNQYVNDKKTGCMTKCFPGYGLDPTNSGQCTLCTVTPTRLQVWVSETVGQVMSFTCALTTCPDGQYPFLSPAGRECTPCAQPTGLPSSVTATLGQGCAVKACSVDPNSLSVESATLVAPDIIPPANCLETGGCTTVGSCALVCKPGFTGASCSPCPQPPGIKATYSTACVATSCSVDTSSPDASKVSGATVVNGNCITGCSPGFWKYLEYGCYACGARTGDDPLTTRTYGTNSCNPASCTVDASLVGKATAAPATVYGYPNVSVCMLTPAKGYRATYSTSITGDYISIGGPFEFRTASFTRSAASTISACPAGDTGTTYTYSSGCSLATCTYTNPNDANESATPVIGSEGVAKCTKVCKTGFKRDASGKCTVACSQPSDLGLTATFGPYGCKISACTSSSGFPTVYGPAPGATYGSDSFMYGDTCTVACPAGARQYTNTNASPNRQDCSKCTTDLSINPWIFSSTCSLVGNFCSLYGTITQRKLWSPGVYETTATATQSGSTCTTTCNSGYVKDSFGVCRKCPNQTPSSTSAVVNGVCVTTCKTNHTRDVTYDGKEFNVLTEQRFDPLFGVNGRTSTAGQLYQAEIVCPQCTNGTTWDTASMNCINCSQASTASTTIRNCNQVCNAGYYFNKATGVCDTCPAGSYCGGGGGTAVNPIIQCPVGTYCPAGSGSATACSIGYSCPTAGLTSQTACGITLASGYIWSNPRVNCTYRQCTAGSYCPDSTTESVCYNGEYCPAGSTTRSDCPAGYYCSGPSSRTQCDVGYSCPARSTSQTSCGYSGLQAGLVWSNPRVDCTFRQCSAGYYCPNATTETACESGTYSSAGATTCTTCSRTCQVGEYQTTACTATTNRVCTGCASWMYCAYPGLTNYQTVLARTAQACPGGWDTITMNGYPCTTPKRLMRGRPVPCQGVELGIVNGRYMCGTDYVNRFTCPTGLNLFAMTDGFYCGGITPYDSNTPWVPVYSG